MLSFFVSCSSRFCSYFSKTGAIVFAKATLYFVDGWGDFGEFLTISFFGLGAHAGNGQNLSVFDDALLQLAKQDPKALGEVSAMGI